MFIMDGEGKRGPYTRGGEEAKGGKIKKGPPYLPPLKKVWKKRSVERGVHDSQI